MCISTPMEFLTLILLKRNTPLLMFLKETSDFSVKILLLKMWYNLRFFLNTSHI